MESRYASPYVSGITWQLNKLNISDVIQTNTGPRTTYSQREPFISFDVTNSIANREVGVISYNFPNILKDGQEGVTMSELLKATETNIIETWSTVILSEMTNLFPVLAGQDEEMSGLGTKFNIRLDSIKIALPVVGNKYVIATIGVYMDDDFNQPTSYIELVFADNDVLKTRDIEKYQLNISLQNTQSILDNPDSTTEQKTQAAISELKISRKIAELESQLVAKLSLLLSKENIQNSLKDLVKALFITLKANDNRWANIDVQNLMSLFVLPNVT